jgi:hypothetical protein
MLRFNTLLRDADIDPADVRLLRHQPQVAGRSLLDIWRVDPQGLEAYQARQPVSGRTSFQRKYWASFVGTWDGRTIFVGLYEVLNRQGLDTAGSDPLSGQDYEAGRCCQSNANRSPHDAIRASSAAA